MNILAILLWQKAKLQNWQNLLKQQIFPTLKNMLTEYTQDESMKLQRSYLKYFLLVS